MSPRSSNPYLIQFIRNYTAEPIGNAVQEAAQSLGLTVHAEFGAYENLGMELAQVATADPSPAIVILTIDLEYFAGGLYSPLWDMGRTRDELQSLLEAVDRIPAKSLVLLSTLLPPFSISIPWVPSHPVLGRAAAAFELNQILREFVAHRPTRYGLLDFERIAARLGETATFDRRFGLMNKAPFKEEFVNAAAAEITRFLRARYLPPKKVLILDCDNTLWGGVVGEAGLENIHLDPYEYPGVAYYRFQSEVLSVAAKGFLVCLCSKNEESSVWQVLDHHPHCLLKRTHLASHRINWENKAANIKDLALELNLGLDSMVFVDDEPAECELVRSQFPEITVLQVPKKIYEYPGILAASGLFDVLSVSSEDAQRVQYYQAERERRNLQKRQIDAKGFLQALEMKAVIRPVQTSDISRAAQLCQRTNQFNLTTRRYTEADLTGFVENPDVKMFLLEAQDRFGPMGQSGLIIWKRTNGAAEVDTFLMSCRIIGRQFDRALFAESLRQVNEAWPVERVRAAFIASPKNKIVANLWKEYGLEKEASEEGEMYARARKDLKIDFPDVIELQR